MKLKSVELSNFRNISNSKIEFKSTTLSGIYGPNGTGKTSIIEALQILQKYFQIEKNNFMEEELRKQINKVMKIGETVLSIQLEIEGKKNKYQLKVSFEKDVFGNISVLEEEIKEKEADGNRKVFKSLVKFDNTKKEILPQMIFRKKNIESNKIIEEILLREKINKQSLNMENARMNSYLNLILVQVQKNQKKENKVELSPYLEELFYSLGQLKNYIYEMFIITLQDQAMFNMGNLIKMNIHLDREDETISKVHGEVPIFLVPENNYYPEEIANLIFETIEQINGIFRTMVSDSILLCKEEGEKVGAYGVKEKALNLYVKKGNDEIFIENESAGIKKIISILSALVHFIKGENALVVIDELDAIFLNIYWQSF